MRFCCIPTLLFIVFYNAKPSLIELLVFKQFIKISMLVSRLLVLCMDERWCWVPLIARCGSSGFQHAKCSLFLQWKDHRKLCCHLEGVTSDKGNLASLEVVIDEVSFLRMGNLVIIDRGGQITMITWHLSHHVMITKFCGWEVLGTYVSKECANHGRDIMIDGIDCACNIRKRKRMKVGASWSIRSVSMPRC